LRSAIGAGKERAEDIEAQIAELRFIPVNFGPAVEAKQLMSWSSSSISVPFLLFQLMRGRELNWPFIREELEISNAQMHD
jgi:hypothetical protein